MNNKSYLILKRISDIFLSLIALLLLSPFLIIVAIFIKVDSKGPVFYRQERLGRNRRIFILMKFRSMTNKKRLTHRQIFKGDNEVTRVGRFLRKTKIDEVPQLFNVFCGDMSLIGPRPCLPQLQEQFDKNGEFRILVRPGLSGLAQVNGNIYLTWPQRWVYDRLYVENLSFLLDLKILFKTIAIVIFGEDKFIKPAK